MTAYVVDANLIVLLAVGSFDLALLGGRHKRCREFDAVDFMILDEMLASADAVICTPHAFAEASNLIRLIGDPLKSQLTQHLGELIQRFRERYPTSVAAASDAAFSRLGLTDASLLTIDEEHELLTNDLDLYVETMSRGAKAINFVHERERRAPR